MDFTWTPNKNNTFINYKEITKQFCNNYYNYYDNTFNKLENLYNSNSYFNFLNEEIIGFKNLYNRIKQYNIKKFTHHSINITAQPIENGDIFILVTGTISINDSLFHNRFSETIILSINNNNFYINNTIFTLIN